MRLHPVWLALYLALSGFGGCSALQTSANDEPASILLPSALTSIRDKRPRFRQAFCAALVRDRGTSNPDCSDWLTRLGDEPTQDETVTSDRTQHSAQDVELLIIPGIFGECVRQVVTVFGDAAPHMAKLGFDSATIPVHGRASAELNARVIRDFISGRAADNPGKRFVLLAYSKGTTDAMHALVDYPELRSKVLALISFAGVVNGTPLADSLAELYTATLGNAWSEKCPPTDAGEVSSLTRKQRLNWLVANRLPPEVAYFSVVAMPSPERVSAVLAPFHSRLARIDPRNDSQVLHFDAIIPGSTLLGYANADHWAIALPFETESPFLASTLVTQNHFPRAQLVEAAVQVALEQAGRAQR